ncbi:MAG: biosynthetic arginine decarboxylase [Pelovirga sp.]
MNNSTPDNWTTRDAAALYGIEQWGAGAFTVTAAGDVAVTIPFPTGPVSVTLPEVLQGAHQRGYELPLLLRIENLLDAQIAALNDSFREAIRSSGYQGRYRGVFPVKVNQQAAVIDQICRFGRSYGHGLEAGSKAELMLCLAHLDEAGLLICNGYKDEEFIDLGLWANKLGLQCIFVIESPSELPLIISRSRLLGIKPRLGLRIKISAKVGGLWTETTGDRSSFGLTTAQLIATVDLLRTEQMLDCLQLLHCHLGSQIPDLAQIRTGVREACRFYIDLCAEGVPLSCLDLGGGLAVDYAGSRTTHSHSCNYSLAEYSRCLVTTVRDTLAPHGLPHPTLITESGRATVARTSILFLNILDVMRFEPFSIPAALPDSVHPLISAQFQLHAAAAEVPIESAFLEARSNRDQIRELFRNGEVSLRHRGMAENLYLAIARRLALRIQPGEEPPSAALAELQDSLADIYYGNFSVFQSLPDSWAIGQIYPVMPIHRLAEYPQRRGSISDLTCDCDGKLDRFILAAGTSNTLPLHSLKDGEDYVLGVFLMGAYQETLGDLHNLFGDTNVISIRINEGGGFDVTHEQSGDTIAEVLSMLEYNPVSFYDDFRTKLESYVRQGTISIAERQQILAQFAARLRDHTYFKTS